MAARKKTTEFRKRSQAAIRGWETREARRIEREALEAAEFERRSRAALRGWKTRKAAERVQRAYERAEREGIRAEGASKKERVKVEPKAKPAPKEHPPGFRATKKKARKSHERPPKGFVELKPLAFEERKKKHPKVKRAFEEALTDLYFDVSGVAKKRAAMRKRKKRVPQLTDKQIMQRRLLEGLHYHERQLDEVVSDLAAEGEMTPHELYELFFSPEAA